MSLLSSIVLLLIAARFSASTRITIVTSPSNPCHGVSERNGLVCFTLQQFVSSQITFQNLTLELESGVHVLETTYSIITTNNYLEITGNNATIVCKYPYYYYSSYNSLYLRYLQAVNISGITFVNCSRIYINSVPLVTISESNFLYGVYSSSLYLRYGTTVSIRSCTFVGRSSQSVNGLYLYGIPASVTIDSCTFVSNNYGVQMSLSYINFNVSFQSCNFFDNRIGIRQTTTVNTSIDTCTFIGNRQSIYISTGTVVIHNSTFRSNGISSYPGSVLYFSGSNTLNVEIMESTIINNTASNGAIYISHNRYGYSSNIPTSLIIDRCTFINNFAYGSGGALYLYLRRSRYSSASYYPSNHTISRSVFINNRATVSGGAISAVGNLSIVDTVFGYNNAPQCAALELRSTSLELDNVNLSSSTFLYNEALNSTSLNNNTLAQVQFGGVACFQDTSVIINNSTFSHNTAAGGGGVMIVEGSNITIDGSFFRNNTAGIDGGVLYTRLSSSKYTITRSSFTFNRAGDDGGVIYSGGAGNIVTISESSFSHNTAADRGGAIITFRGVFGVTRTNMFNNRANSGNDVVICSAPIVLTPAYFDTSFQARTYMTEPLCWFYGGFTSYFSIQTPDDRSNTDVAHYLQVPGAINNRPMIIAAPRVSENPTTFGATTTEDHSLKKLENKLVETSTAVYVFFSLALAIVVTVIIAVVVKFCIKKKTKKGSMNIQHRNTAVSSESNKYDDDVDIYEEPVWKDNPASNAISMKPNVVYSKN